MKTNIPALRSRRAFSLVEVSVAISIIAFCLVPALGLLPIGLVSNQNALEQTVAAGLAAALATDLRTTPVSASGSAQSPFYKLSVPNADGGSDTTPRSVFLNEDGTLATAASAARYRASIWFHRPEQGQGAATVVRILLTWPAAADANPSAVPEKFSGAFETVVTLDRN